jgi:uncharacterized protein (TIGR02391 family)
MNSAFFLFENFARNSSSISQAAQTETHDAHPFDERNIHPDIVSVSANLFDNGHYSQATFEAFKLLDNKVKAVAGLNESGYKLMMAAFSEANPRIRLTNLLTTSEIDEQSGFKFIFAGSMTAIRNPRGHDIKADSIDLCLDHLSLASVLVRTLESRTWPKIVITCT